MRLVDARRLTGPNHLGAVAARDRRARARARRSASTRRASAYARELARMRAALGLPGRGRARHAAARGRRGLRLRGADRHDARLRRDERVGRGERVRGARRPRAARRSSRSAPRSQAMLARDRNPRLVALVDEARASAASRCSGTTSSSASARPPLGVVPARELPGRRRASPWERARRDPDGRSSRARTARRPRRGCSRAWRPRRGCASAPRRPAASRSAPTSSRTATGPGPRRRASCCGTPDVELAVLETARGGILRRGLAVDTCDAALVTNVSDDHLGLYGIDDVERDGAR